MVDDTLNTRDEIGRKSSTATMDRNEPVSEKVKDGWMDFKAKIRQKWNQVSDNDLDTYKGRDRNEFVGQLHGKVGGDRTVLERDIDTFARDTRYRW